MLELDKDQLASLYMQGNAAVRKSLREMLGERLNEEIPVTSRVRTFNDAIEELGEAHEAVKAYRDIEWKLGKEHKDLLAYLKLRIITEALNEGWKPQFTEGERRWYAWYELLTKEEMDAMSDKEKEERRVVGRAFSYAYAYGGLVYANAHHVSSGTNHGSRLAFKSEELAEYAGKQFAEIYADYCFIPETPAEA